MDMFANLREMQRRKEQKEIEARKKEIEIDVGGLDGYECSVDEMQTVPLFAANVVENQALSDDGLLRAKTLRLDDARETGASQVHHEPVDKSDDVEITSMQLPLLFSRGCNSDEAKAYAEPGSLDSVMVQGLKEEVASTPEKMEESQVMEPVAEPSSESAGTGAAEEKVEVEQNAHGDGETSGNGDGHPEDEPKIGRAHV